MKSLLLITCMVLSTSAYGQSEVGDLFLSSARAKWEHAKDYVVTCAKSMPSEYYDFKPTPIVLSYKKQLIHSLQNMNWITVDYLGGQGLVNDMKDANPSKEELIALLEQAFENAALALDGITPADLVRKVDFFAGEMTILQMINLLDDHLTHHKGQLVVYLRLKDIAPPRFVGW